MNHDGDHLKGVLCALGAYVAWGLLPIYWKVLAQVPAFEILNHRVLWSAIVIAIVLTLWRKWGQVGAILRSPKKTGILTVSTLTIACNWFTFTWAVTAGHVLEVSLGYFINPILSVVLGIVFLRERLRRVQVAAVILAAAGVAILTISYGQFPWIALVLAASFGTYGLIRKTAPVDALLGLGIETFLLSVPALIYLTYLGSRGEGAWWAGGTQTTLFLTGAGVVTFLPLWSFTEGARRLRLSTVGLLQYSAPSLHFVLAVFSYHEEFTRAHLISFCFIWAALAIFSFEALYVERRMRRRMKR